MLNSSRHARSLPCRATSRSTPLMTRSSTCGTTSSSVTLRSVIVLNSVTGLRLRGYVTFAPALSGISSPPTCSNMWLSGSMDTRRYDGSPGMNWRMESRFERRFLCVSITPFGSPVVPDVNMISARPSGSSSTGDGSPRPSQSESTSSKSMVSRPSSLCTAGVTRDANISRGSVCAAMLRAKSAVLRTSSGTATAPALRHAKKASTHCGQFGPQMRTRSPFWIPCA